VRLSKASKIKFAHNDTKDLEKKLAASTAAKKIVLVESVYSMNGNVAPLKEIVEIVEANNALLIVDEAHATGIFGDTCAGLVQALGLEKRIWCRVHTYSKAMGLQGAAVVGSKLLINYLINFSRSFIYATAMPPVNYSQILIGYDLFEKKENLTALQKNIKLFSDLFNFLPQTSLSTTPIQNISIPGNENALACSSFLRAQGIYAKALLSPTVPEGKECIRICLHSFNTIQEIELLHHTLKTFLK
jgi:8-amino-7-oxononanoate synthase